jgi:Zn-dependent peptidase ImmA (M78 family)/DNA-binding XRE family transcriptional regulator
MPEIRRLRSDEFDGQWLTLARQLRGLRKTELAEMVGVSAGALTQYEDGSIRPRSSVLSSFALALRVPQEFFAARGPAPQVNEHEFHFRRLRRSRKLDRSRVLAGCAVLSKFVENLEHHVALPKVDIPGDLALVADESRETSSASIEAAAARLRKDWGLGEGPISNMVRLLESKGCVVVRAKSETDDIDAFSGRWGGRPYVVLTSDKGDVARSRFDAAHELGHLVLHPDPDPTDREHEVQAHAFASAFLMPRSAIAAELPKAVQWPEFIRLKSRWKVSIQALLRRASAVGTLTEAQYRRGVVMLSARGWRTQEPGDAGPLEEPTLLANAIKLVGQKKGLDWRILAKDIRLNDEDFRVLLASAMPSTEASNVA